MSSQPTLLGFFKLSPPSKIARAVCFDSNGKRSTKHVRASVAAGAVIASDCLSCCCWSERPRPNDVFLAVCGSFANSCTQHYVDDRGCRPSSIPILLCQIHHQHSVELFMKLAPSVFEVALIAQLSLPQPNTAGSTRAPFPHDKRFSKFVVDWKKGHQSSNKLGLLCFRRVRVSYRVPYFVHAVEEPSPSEAQTHGRVKQWCEQDKAIDRCTSSSLQKNDFPLRRPRVSPISPANTTRLLREVMSRASVQIVSPSHSQTSIASQLQFAHRVHQDQRPKSWEVQCQHQEATPFVT